MALIPQAAIEAAIDALQTTTPADGTDWETVMIVLEAAAPHIRREVQNQLCLEPSATGSLYEALYDLESLISGDDTGSGNETLGENSPNTAGRGEEFISLLRRNFGQNTDGSSGDLEPEGLQDGHVGEIPIEKVEALGDEGVDVLLEIIGDITDSPQAAANLLKGFAKGRSILRGERRG